MDERPCRSGEQVGCDALAAVGGGYEETRDAEWGWEGAGMAEEGGCWIYWD
jgi:hypothetical protein